MREEIAILLHVVFILISLLLSGFVYLVAQKVRDNRVNAKRDEQVEKYRPFMYRYLLEGIQFRLLVPLKGFHSNFAALEQLLEQCAAILGDEEVKERIHSYATRYFTQMYRERMKDRRWSVRMNTLYLIEKFNMHEMETDIIQALGRKRNTNLVESAQTFKLLALWGSEHLRELIQNHPLLLSDFQRKMILSKLPVSLFTKAVKGLREFPLHWQLGIIDMIGIQRKEQYREFVEQLMEDRNDELRIRALEALSQMSLIMPKPAFIKHAESPLWQERVAAAKLYASIRHAMYLPCLHRLMSDTSWLVCSQAAQAISVFPDGLELLKDISETATDTYARDIANEWWERGGGRDAMA